ncbi:Serine/threonine protein kinase [Cryobacterium flavum]|uniref:Serine/threonine protein kinase n=1 Tax=Cryobacterium flavum TaxID=1424659 RepID=A0A4R8V2G5_9MICO|nr:serine/threonine-protein kinase [Cryobacterium sp. N19]TFB75598.1 serine/threonine protein kinase [Cryobacterium flavum]SDN76648.1 Serine/threonine protein kinase [Cryobacterium flavum]
MCFARGWTHQEVPLSYEPIPIQQLPTPGPVGSLLGDRFLIETLIGTGGMASVYRATDTALGRTVAVKLFRADGGAAEPERQSGEIALLASLNHFALVTLFDAGTATVDGVPRTFIVMELVDGPDLRARIASGPLPSLEVAVMGADLAEALHYVHEQGIIHRDVKPANVLLSPSGFPGRSMHAKLADFGIARLLDESRLTATGSLLGTASYLSPEQALGALIGAPTDVYSLGLVLLECLTGVRAYPGTAVESAMARLQRQPEIPSTLGRDWTEVLAAMTARDTGDRPTASEASLLLRALATGAEDQAVATLLLPARAVEAAATEVLRADPAPTPKPATAAISRKQTGTTPAPRRNRVILWIVLAALVVTAIVLGALFLGSGDDPPAVPPSYPAVDGTLGTHLEQLQESVNP